MNVEIISEALAEENNHVSDKKELHCRDCFIRIRSGQTFDNPLIKSSLHCRTIVDCQLECLNSKHFTCRAFSYRFGQSYPGVPQENCVLTDWPPTEIDPRIHLVPAAGFELYERGSFGHGCENDRPSLGVHGAIQKHTDKLCYVGFASPSRLLPEAAKGSLSVGSEADCKVECTRARENTQFPCMAFSYRVIAEKGEPNCELSDIPQTDLQPEVDYTREATSYLYAWDHNNPQCNNRRQDTWSMYTVNGWPCKKGTVCQENREAGFWSCELESGEVGSWDYCCRPDHKCGYSHGYSYPWCYVGPSSDQWRKCSEKYHPFNHQMITDKKDTNPHHHRPSNNRPQAYNTWYKEKPFKPPYYHRKPGLEGPLHEKPNLNQYEQIFSHQFLDPPKPGGFGQLKTLPRHWPVSYLHKEGPPNAKEDIKHEENQKENKKNENNDRNKIKYGAIEEMVKTIKENSTKIIKERPSRDEEEEILLVRIPMTEKTTTNPKNVTSDFDDLFLISVSKNKTNKTEPSNFRTPKRDLQVFPVRRGYVTRTNRTAIRKRRLPKPFET